MKSKPKTSIIIFSTAITVLMVFSSISVGCDDPPPCVENDEVILKAGQNIDVGIVKIWHDNENLYVKYILDDDFDGCEWTIYETHLSVVVGSWELHPQGKNLKIGHFEFTEPTEEDDMWHLYVISWDDDLEEFNWGDELDIAAHAVVMKYCDGEFVQGETAWGNGDPHWKNWAMSFTYRPCEYKMPSLPTGSVSYYVTTGSGVSYFRTHITDGGGGEVINGEWEGWCIDTGHTISTGSGNVYTGDLMIPDSSHDKWCEWHKVNWILNNHADYDWEETQAAIWHIYLGTEWGAGSSMGSGINLDAGQLADAQELAGLADDKCWFRAFSGDWIAVILTPTTNNQVTIIVVDP